MKHFERNKNICRMRFHWARVLSIALSGNFLVFAWSKNSQIQSSLQGSEFIYWRWLKFFPWTSNYFKCQVFVQASTLTMKTRLATNLLKYFLEELYWFSCRNLHRIRMSNCSKASLNSMIFVYLHPFHAISNRSLTHRTDQLLRNIQLNSSQQISCWLKQQLRNKSILERVNCFDDFNFSSPIYTEWNSMERCGDASQLNFFDCRKLFYNRIADKMECGKCQKHWLVTEKWKQHFVVTLGFILIPHSKKEFRHCWWVLNSVEFYWSPLGMSLARGFLKRALGIASSPTENSISQPREPSSEIKPSPDTRGGRQKMDKFLQILKVVQHVLTF